MRTLGAFIDWSLRNFLRIILIAAIAFGIFTLGIQACEKKLDQAPDVTQAKLTITTTSRVYFANSVTAELVSGKVIAITGPYVLQPTSKDLLILNEYWTKEGGRWAYKRDRLVLSDAYGKREVMLRSVK